MSCVQHSEKPKRIIVLLDPRELTRTALRRSFSEGLHGLYVAAIADLSELSDFVNETLRLVVVHLDRQDLSGSGGEDLLIRLKSMITPVPFVTLAVDGDDAVLSASAQAGASAHLTTSMPLDRACATLRLVMLGGTAFPAQTGAAPIGIARHGEPSFRPVRIARLSAANDCSERLTPREEDVLRYVSEGAQNKTIAFRLNMSENTVKVHLHRILQKLHLHNRTEVALLAHSYFAQTDPGRSVTTQMRAQNEPGGPVAL